MVYRRALRNFIVASIIPLTLTNILVNIKLKNVDELEYVTKKFLDYGLTFKIKVRFSFTFMLCFDDFTQTKRD